MESELTKINAGNISSSGTDPTPIQDNSATDSATESGTGRAFEKSVVVVGSRALAEEDDPHTARKGQVTPRDGLSKLTRMHDWLLTDETGKHMSPILWARLRKPFISYVRYCNIGYLLLRVAALILGAILWRVYYSDIGLWVFISSLVDLAMCALCEVGARRVFQDILEYAGELVTTDIESHEDVPNDTVGQSILEGYWWIALLKFCDHLAFVVYVFSYPDATSDRIKEYVFFLLPCMLHLVLESLFLEVIHCVYVCFQAPRQQSWCVRVKVWE